ncbi:MAG: thiamine phosphate synthase [Nitrospirales bacterium]|nr:thiamine phosphate synthase [Nitrospira sp.]MDR4501665.1 thiamine phosphate synthase [Nitrospirales bacterium]
MTKKTLPRLYVVTNRRQTRRRPLPSIINETLRAGTKFIQFREKDLDTRQLLSLASELASEAHRHDALLLVNDRADIARCIGADGVHLPAHSLPIPQVRKFLGISTLIGKSTHSQEDVCVAEGEGADFLVLGPIYDTPSKRPYGPPLGIKTLKTVCQRSTLPIYAIGGITLERVQEVKDAGAYGVAVISAILEAVQVSAATKNFINALDAS